ncbi:hypothetical protein SMACR_03241 [Sordaria macrospora]|uniref:WGS project CABT00000000 data, contig 2.7 n=2 Tax=Sordaria macrospora TaxID=5147 RepID=F7VTU3_SORMK|nr:uncharacterized protein SMAC_03241 [Sordaria macrospora k-hell]KAA8634440.1 hypothetical protein SMACR_03241 [Sordaria macrospora]KAH7632692.1 hypothetical protein B0T09DRAFT_394896 [Sordaria sp. MPI-SDFR-AT-0083]WPJ60826.1 hypothetical protein SMAC4_03241 [Sordaria macrospora]CCC08931.1 unnamed protein product [Sordaria macrospora k-hell]
MFPSTPLLFLPVLGLVAANKVTFISLDQGDRVIYSKHKLGCAEGNQGCEDLIPLAVPGLTHVSLDIPTGWEGNFYSVPAGTRDRTGMLAEIRAQGFESKSWFDVSAIDNPGDHVGVKQFWPANDPNAEVSGCITFPCDHAYYHPDDKQTKKPTKSEEFYCTLGNADLAKYPHLAQWHMLYSDKHQKWLPMSIPSVTGADASVVAVHGGPAATGGTTTAESPTATHTAVADETDNADEEDAVDEADATDEENTADEADVTNEEDTAAEDYAADEEAADEEDATEETDIANETASSHPTLSTLVTSVKKQTATPTMTFDHSHGHHGYTVAANHTASD